MYGITLVINNEIRNIEREKVRGKNNSFLPASTFMQWSKSIQA